MDAPLERGPLLRWQRKAIEMGMRSVSIDGYCSRSALCNFMNLQQLLSQFWMHHCAKMSSVIRLTVHYNKLCESPPQYATPPASWPSTFDLESGVQVTCDVGYLCANFSLPRPLCSQLCPSVRDRQTADTHHRLMPPPYGAGHNNALLLFLFCSRWSRTIFSNSTLLVLVGLQEGHLACKSIRVLVHWWVKIWPEVWADDFHTS